MTTATTTKPSLLITRRREPSIHAAVFGLDAILPRAALKAKRPTTAPGTTSKSVALTPTAGGLRYASSGQPPREDCNKLTWQEWIFGPDQKKDSEPLKEGDLLVRLEEESGSIFKRRSLTAKAALDPRLRCTEVDENGKVITVDGELKKSELIAKVRRNPRPARRGTNC